MSRAQTLAKTRAQSRKPPEPKAPRGTGAFLAGKNLNIVLCVLLATATIALYSPVFGYGFVILDDQEYVTGNPHVQNGLAWSTIKWAFTSTETAAYWHPLTWLSHALDYQLFALDPAGHHFHNVLIHALNAVLLFLLLQWVTRRVAPSLLVAALFAVHPLNVESVAWVAERKNVLSTLVLFTGDRSLCEVCPKARLASLSAGSGAVRRRVDGQANGDHATLCPVAAGLLAAE